MKKVLNWLKCSLGFWIGRDYSDRDMTLNEAMVTIAGRLGARDSFCVREDRWRHDGRKLEEPSFCVSVFKGDNHIAAQVEDKNLRRAVERALLAWDADPATPAQ